MSYKLWKGNVAASDVSSGTLADARVASSNVTQYETELEGVLDINQLQVTGLLDMGSYAVRSTHTASNAADLINKQYFDDNVTSGTEWKAAVSEQSNTAPGTPSDGDRVLVGPSGSGDFSGHSNKIAVYSSAGAAWSFESPSEGWTVYVLGGSLNADSIVIYNGSAWVVMSNASGALIKTNNLSDLSSASTARSNLGLGTLATLSSVDLASNVGSTVLPITNGGTGSSSAAMVGVITAADASAARSVLGLGTVSTQSASSVAITGGSITGITDLAVADGGTGASTASDARTNLGLGTAAVVDTASSNSDSGKIPALGTVSGSVAAVTVNSSGAIVDASISSSDVSGLGTAATVDVASSTSDSGKIPTLASGLSGGNIAVKVGSSGTIEGVNSFTVSNISDAGDAASKNVVSSLSLTSGRVFVADSSSTFSAGDLLKLKSDGTIEPGSAGGTGTVTSIAITDGTNTTTAITSSGSFEIEASDGVTATADTSSTKVTISGSTATSSAKGVVELIGSSNYTSSGVVLTPGSGLSGGSVNKSIPVQYDSNFEIAPISLTGEKVVKTSSDGGLTTGNVNYSDLTADRAIQIETDGVTSGAPSSFPSLISNLKGLYLYDLSGETSTSSITLPQVSNTSDLGYEVSIGVLGGMSTSNALTISAGTYTVSGGSATALIDDGASITLNSNMQVLTIVAVRVSSNSDSNGSTNIAWKIK